jgi:hypothetical protein
MSPERSTGVSPVTQQRTSYVPFLTFLLGFIACIRIWQFFVKLPIAEPFQNDYEEGNILNALLRIIHGSTPYPDPHALPNIINPYGPAAYYLLVLPVKLFGLAFAYPRAMILGCVLLIALLIAIELQRATQSTPLAVTLALVFLSVPNIQEWAWLLRVDLLGIAFTTAGLVAFTRHAERNRPATFLPGVFFAIGLLVKPTLVAAPAACFFALLARRKFPDAANLTGVTLGAFGLVMAIFSAITRGAILIDVFLSHPDPFEFRVYTQWLTRMLVLSWPLVLLAVIAMARDLARLRFSAATLWLPMTTLTAITAGKLGSNQNHFLEWNTALCLAAGLGLRELVGISARKLALVATGVAVVAAALVISRQPDYLADVDPERGCPAAYDWVRTQAGPNLLSENVGSLVLGKKKVWVSNLFVLAQLVERGGWSDDNLVQMVRERHFDAILTRLTYRDFDFVHGAERFSPQFLRALNENYVPKPTFQCKDMNIVYWPKNSAAIQSSQATSR